MAASVNVIRLVGGPPKLDGTLCDLRVSARDRADARGDQFVRAVHGTSVTSLSALQGRCTDRAHADELAAAWRALVYRSATRPLARWRPAVYRFEGHYSLEPSRNAQGRWGLTVCAKLSGPTLASPPPATSLWASLETSVDDAAGRFDTVAALIPDGLHVERVADARRAVASCVADAARLCAVGVATAPSGVGERTPALAARVVELVRAIDRATAEIVDLHLELDHTLDPVEPVAGLAHGWAELHD
jgi:hypothetical protein